MRSPAPEPEASALPLAASANPPMVPQHDAQTAFGGALLWRMSPELNLQAAFAFGVAGTLWFAWKGRDCVSPAENGPTG